MKLTQEQIEFLDEVCVRVGYVSYGECYLDWVLNSNGEVDVDGHVVFKDGVDIKEIPVKFGSVTGVFDCSNNNLTTLKNCPYYIGEQLYLGGNNLTEYFKTIKEEDFPHWNKLYWNVILKEYPFLINIAKKHLNKHLLSSYLNFYPQLKLYLD